MSISKRERCGVLMNSIRQRPKRPVTETHTNPRIDFSGLVSEAMGIRGRLVFGRQPTTRPRVRARMEQKPIPRCQHPRTRRPNPRVKVRSETRSPGIDSHMQLTEKSSAVHSPRKKHSNSFKSSESSWKRAHVLVYIYDLEFSILCIR